MITAALIVYVLIPEDLSPRMVDAQPAEGTQAEVSAVDTLEAAGSVLKDIGGFCERNPDTCATGMILLEKTKETVQAGLDRIAERQTTGQLEEVEGAAEIKTGNGSNE